MRSIYQQFDEIAKRHGVHSPEVAEVSSQEEDISGEPAWLIRNRILANKKKIPPVLASLSVFSVPLCGSIGYLLATTSEADFVGLHWFMSIFLGIVVGAILGLTLLSVSRGRDEDADVSRLLGLIVNWGAIVLSLGLLLM